MRKTLLASASHAAIDSATQASPLPKSPGRKPGPGKTAYDDDPPLSDRAPARHLDARQLPPPRGPPLDPRIYGLVKAAYTVNEVIDVLSLGRTSLYELIKEGKLNPAKFGKKTLFLAPDLAAFLAKLQEAS